MSTERLKSRLQRMEGSQHQGDAITEVHYHVINRDRTSALMPDGTTWVIVSEIRH